MLTLVIGVVLWIDAHLFKRLLPELRGKLGDRGKGLVALTSLLAIVLMVIGYRTAHGAVYWGPTPAMTGINNLLMLGSVYLLAASGMKLAITRRMRHPMLMAVVLWSIAHLLVNGDVESFILFGGLLIWAVASMRLINRDEPEWVKPEPKPMSKEVIGVVAALVVYGAITGIHMVMGLQVFG